MNWAGIVFHNVSDFSGPPTLLHCYITVYSKAAPYTVAFVVIWALVRMVLTRTTAADGTLKSIRVGTWAHKSAIFAHHAFITPLSLLAMWEDKTITGMYGCVGCIEVGLLMNRSTQPSLSARALCPVTLGYFIGDLILLNQWDQMNSGSVETCLTVMHHIVSLLVWPAALYFDWVSRYIIIMLSYEFTSVWLIFLWMLSRGGLKKHLLYKLVGLVFTLSFVLIRMVGAVPQLMAMWNAPPWSKKLEREAQPGGIHDLCSFCSASLVLPHLLNLFWGVKVVRGFAADVASLYGKGKDNTEKNK